MDDASSMTLSEFLVTYKPEVFGQTTVQIEVKISTDGSRLNWKVVAQDGF